MNSKRKEVETSLVIVRILEGLHTRKLPRTMNCHVIIVVY